MHAKGRMSSTLGILTDPYPKSSSIEDDESPVLRPPTNQSTYSSLIQQLFSTPAVVAVFGAGTGDQVRDTCTGIASELASVGRRAVVVSVQALLDPMPSVGSTEDNLLTAEPVDSEGMQKYWLWPPRGGHRAESFGFRRPGKPEAWVDSLRRNFDAVLLDCQSVETTPGSVAVGTLADAAILVVEAARTPKTQILRDKRALQLTGIKLAGCILTQGK